MTTQRVTIQKLLARARVRYRRLSPRQAYEAMQAGALLIDVRDGDQRRRDGVIPGALMIDRSSLAVASLLDLGATRVTDVIGGFQGWQAAGLPVSPVPPTGA